MQKLSEPLRPCRAAHAPNPLDKIAVQITARTVTHHDGPRDAVLLDCASMNEPLSSTSRRSWSSYSELSVDSSLFSERDANIFRIPLDEQTIDPANSELQNVKTTPAARVENNARNYDVRSKKNYCMCSMTSRLVFSFESFPMGAAPRELRNTLFMVDHLYPVVAS
jgi:hypothetical protein